MKIVFLLKDLENPLVYLTVGFSVGKCLQYCGGILDKCPISSPWILGEIGEFEVFEKPRAHAFACYKNFNLGCCDRTSNSPYLQYKPNNHLNEYIVTGAVRFSCSQLLILGEKGAFEVLEYLQLGLACFRVL